MDGTVIAWFSLMPAPIELVGFALGWCGGWLAFWRARPLPPRRPAARHERIAVVIPARNEAAAIATVVGGLVAAPGDEIVVVDDHSVDATGARAAAAGARVVAAPELPSGWFGKPHACDVGVGATDAPVLVFLDADVSPPPDLLDRLATEVRADPEALVSVQPWHRPGSAAEQLSLPFNVVALMGSGGFAPRRAESPLAFGPVLACARERYLEVGGHADPRVRAAVAEDLAMGANFGRVRLFTGRPDISFRMFPGGVRGVLDGWTKHISVGAGRTAPWLLAAVVAWIWSQTVGWAVSPWCYVASTAQLAVFARRAGRFSPWAVLLGPLLMVVFTAIVVRSAVRRARRRPVRWKGRSVEIG